MFNYAFCDASFDHKKNIAVTGYRLMIGSNVGPIHVAIHDLNSCNEAEVTTLYLTIKAIEDTGFKGWIIYTDNEPLSKKWQHEHIELRFTSGHVKKADRSYHQQLFAEVDQQTRKTLRNCRKILPPQ